MIRAIGRSVLKLNFIDPCYRALTLSNGFDEPKCLQAMDAAIGIVHIQQVTDWLIKLQVGEAMILIGEEPAEGDERLPDISVIIDQADREGFAIGG